jgi:hypothetical protein
MFGSAPSSDGVSAAAAMQHRVPRGIARKPAPTLKGVIAGQCGNGVTRRVGLTAYFGVELGLRHDRIERVEQEKTGEKAADMGLPGDLLSCFGAE